MSEGTLTPPVNDRDHAIGPAAAAVTLVEYGDFECPYCGMAYPIVEAIRHELGDSLRFVFRHFPLAELHPHARHAAEAAEAAAAEGKFWQMHNLIFAHQGELEDDDLTRYAEQLGLDAQRLALELTRGTYQQRVREDFRNGVRSGVNGTPTFFINGRRWDGLWTDSRLFVAALRAASGAERIDTPAAAG